MQTRFGRIRLDTIAAEWGEGSPINPRLLASEVAAILRTVAPTDHCIQETFVSTILISPTPTDGTVTFGALADYFDSTSLGKPAETITTKAGPISASAVTVWRQWMNSLVAEATERALHVAGFAVPANDSPGAAMVASAAPTIRYQYQPPPPSGSEPGYIKQRQARQRLEAERSAVEQLDEWQRKAQRLEAENATLTGQLALSEADLAAEREARGAERIARLEAEERAEAAESELAAMPGKVAQNFSHLERPLVELATWFKKQGTQKGKASDSSTLLVVAGLLELLLDRSRPFYNQGSAADAIAMKGWHGARKRQVNGVFAVAKELARNAKIEATAKASDVQESNVTPPG